MLDPNREVSPEAPQVAAASSAGVRDPAALFEEHVLDIRRAAAHACRNRYHGLSQQDIDDFTGDILVKIMDEDFAVLRKWRHQSSLKVYLASVVQKALMDWVNHEWGKYRNSAEAKRLGPVAQRLEDLTVRDHLGYREASQIVLYEQRGKTTESELARIAEQLPPRTPRLRDVSLDSDVGAGRASDAPRAAFPRLPPEPVAPDRADDRVTAQEEQARRARILRALEGAVEGLPDQEDRVIARMIGDLKVADMARLLQREQKPLYRRVAQIRSQMRRALEAAGVNAADVAAMMGTDHD